MTCQNINGLIDMCRFFCNFASCKNYEVNGKFKYIGEGSARQQLEGC
jgi:hypothetical protein